MNNVTWIRALLISAIVSIAIFMFNFSEMSMQKTPLSDAGLLAVFIIETLLALNSIYFSIRKYPIARMSWTYTAAVAVIFIFSSAFLPAKH